MPTERGCRSHMVRRSIESSQKGLEVHVVGADGRKMSGAQEDGDMAAESFSLNMSAALGRQDQETSAALIGGFRQSHLMLVNHQPGQYLAANAPEVVLPVANVTV